MRIIIKLIAFYFCYQILFSVLMTGAAVFIPLSPTGQLGWALLLSGVALIVHLLAFGYVGKSSLLPSPFKTGIAGVSCIIGAMLCCDALSELVPFPNWLEADFIALCQHPAGILSITLIAPIGEELLFRGAIQGHLQQLGLTPWRSILWSALIFGIVHLNPAQIVFAFLMGTALGWVTWKTGSLIPAIIGHMLNNTLSAWQMHSYGTEETEISSPTLLLSAAIGLLIAFGTGKWLAGMKEENKH